MNKELRRVSIVVLFMFLALFTSTTIIQVRPAGQPAGRRPQRRARSTRASRPSAARSWSPAQPIAESVPVERRVQVPARSTRQGPLYSAVTGYFTLNQGNTGIEGALNDYLSGTANQQFLDQLNAILTGQNPKGAAVELTIDPVVQQAAWDALGDQQGAIVALDPKTGAHPRDGLEADLRPERARRARQRSRCIATYKQLLGDPGDPLINRAIARRPQPARLDLQARRRRGRAVDSGQYTPDSDVPEPAEPAAARRATP